MDGAAIPGIPAIPDIALIRVARGIPTLAHSSSNSSSSSAVQNDATAITIEKKHVR